jgi:pimeloyl-ACP methyl ester carboxylesterase
MNTLFDPKLLPLKRHIASIAGIRTVFWEGGTIGATPIIMLHGLNGSHHGLMPLAERLQDYHIFLPDLPGHGGSGLPAKATVAGVVGWFDKYIRKIAELTGKKPIVLAHSFGSQIAFMSCQQLPGEYEACILLTPVPRVSILPYIFGKSLALLPKRIALELVGSSEQARYWRGTYLLHRRSPELNDLVRWIGDQSANSPDKFAYYVAISQELMGIPAYSREGVQHGSFYCVAGDSDRMLTQDGLNDLKTMFAPRFYLCENTGHLMPIEAPDDTARIVRKLLPSPIA